MPMNYPIGSMVLLYGNMDPINVPQMLAYIPYMDPMGMIKSTISITFPFFSSFNPHGSTLLRRLAGLLQLSHRGLDGPNTIVAD